MDSEMINFDPQESLLRSLSRLEKVVHAMAKEASEWHQEGNGSCRESHHMLPSRDNYEDCYKSLVRKKILAKENLAPKSGSVKKDIWKPSISKPVAFGRAKNKSLVELEYDEEPCGSVSRKPIVVVEGGELIAVESFFMCSSKMKEKIMKATPLAIVFPDMVDHEQHMKNDDLMGDKYVISKPIQVEFKHVGSGGTRTMNSLGQKCLCPLRCKMVEGKCSSHHEKVSMSIYLLPSNQLSFSNFGQKMENLLFVRVPKRYIVDNHVNGNAANKSYLGDQVGVMWSNVRNEGGVKCAMVSQLFVDKYHEGKVWHNLDVRGCKMSKEVKKNDKGLMALHGPSIMNLDMMLNGNRVLAMVDSGSCLNFISTVLIDQIGQPSDSTFIQCNDITTASGHTMVSRLRYDHVSVCIEGQKIFSISLHELPTLGTGPQVILGIPWLTSISPCTMDFKNMTLTILRHGYPCVFNCLKYVVNSDWEEEIEQAMNESNKHQKCSTQVDLETPNAKSSTPHELVSDVQYFHESSPLLEDIVIDEEILDLLFDPNNGLNWDEVMEDVAVGDKVKEISQVSFGDCSVNQKE